MKKSRMKEMSVEVTVGAFIFMVILALGAFTIVLSQDNFFVTNHYVKVRFNEIMGLRTGDKVFLRGVDVGKIVDIEVERDSVLLTASMDKPIKFTEDYKIEIVPVSVLGGKRLVIMPGSESMPEIENGKVLQGTPPKDVLGEATKTISMVRKALEEDQVLDNLAILAADLRKVSDKVSAGEGTLGRLFMDDTLYDDMSSVVADLKEVSERLAAGKGTLGRLFSEDEQLYADLQSTVANLREISDRLAGGKGMLGRMLAEDDPMQQDLSEAIAAINDVAQSIKEGKGSLGKLVNDDSLYDEARLLLIEARATVDDLRETSPITTFSSVFFGAF